MSTIIRRLSVGLGTLLIILMLSMPASGQAVMAGGGVNPNVAPSASYSVPSINSSLTNPNNGLYGSPYYPTNYGRAGGYLIGASAVFESQGKYQMDHAKSKILREKARQDAVETRRKIFDEWMYERNSMPTFQEMREREQKTRIRRALTDPPTQEITSGNSLNTLLDLATKAVDANTNPAVMPTVALSDEVVKHLNVAVGTSGYGLGAIKGLSSGKSLEWPVVLQGSDYAADRKTLDDLTRKALTDAKNGNVNANTIQALQTAYANMSRQLEEDIVHMTPDQYFMGRRYLRQLGDSIHALQLSGVANSLRGMDKVHTVTDLIKEMSGRHFAPASGGDEDVAYVALHQALAAYVMQLQGALPQEK